MGRGFSFATISVHAKEGLPRSDQGPDAVKVTAPPAPTPAREMPGAPVSECDKPYGMIAVTHGPLLDKLTMDDYYPGLRARGFFANPGMAGPWDTGTRCGVNVQLVGSLSLLCMDDAFQFSQTIHHDKSIINGSKDADDGTTHDDIADSGGNYSKPPLRQTRPGGEFGQLNVSMADPPSLLYSAVHSAEWDRTYVTALVGPKGKAEVIWKVSTEVRDGKVVKNTVS